MEKRNLQRRLIGYDLVAEGKECVAQLFTASDMVHERVHGALCDVLWIGKQICSQLRRTCREEEPDHHNECKEPCGSHEP